MGNWKQSACQSLATVVGAAICLLLGLGCAAVLSHEVFRYDYFARPDPYDAWSPKINGWQHRELAEAAPVLGQEAPPVAGPGDAATPDVAAPTPPPVDDLRAKYNGFRAERKREVAREFADWIQREARNHYVPDGPIDHWATLEETLRANGDDCDGLELLVFNGLRDLGFHDDEVYRAIVYRPSDGQHHMVTLWFEDRTDPWVIDPTGAMTSGLRRMSSIADWVPLKVFSDTAEYSVRRVHDLDRDAFAHAQVR